MATGLNARTFDSSVAEYLLAARAASDHGYAVAFVAVAVIALIGLVAVALLVRRPPQTAGEGDAAESGRRARITPPAAPPGDSREASSQPE